MAMSKMYVNRSKYVRKTYKKPANKKLATVGTVKRLINGNIDHVFNYSGLLTASTLTTTAVITNVSNLSNLTYNIDYLILKGFITNPTLNVDCRVILFQWKDNTTPVVADILQSTTLSNSQIGNSGAGTDGPSCGGRMHLLKDLHFTMDPICHTIRTFDFTFYKKQLLTNKFDGVSSENQIFMLTISNTVATPPLITVNRLLKYHAV